MKQKFENKTAVVTGGGSGIGQSICLKLAENGAHIMCLDLTEESAADTVKKVEQLGGSIHAFSCDVSNNEHVTQVIDQILATHAIDILVNNAGIAHIGNIENTSEDDLDRLYRVNVKGVYNTTYAVIKSMKERKSGVIINLASIASTVGIADRFAYSMTKGAVLTMTYSIARDYVDHGIRCNCVAPGRVHTPFVDNFLDNNYPDNRDEMFDKLSKSQPIGRMAEPEEIASLITYLASDDAAFITGTNVPIDGGFVSINN